MANSTQDPAAAFAPEANHVLEQAANKIRRRVTQLETKGKLRKGGQKEHFGL